MHATLENIELSKPNISLSLHFNAIFPREPGLAGFIEVKDDGGGSGNWSYKSRKAPVKSSPPANQHLTFYRPDAVPCHPTSSVKALKRKANWTHILEKYL